MNRIGDIVLIYYQEKPTLYARIEAIEPDAKRDWYQVGLLLLTIPAQVVKWILREEYIHGTPFTMGGRPMRLEGVKRAVPGGDPGGKGQGSKEKGPEKGSKVIPIKRQT